MKIRAGTRTVVSRSSRSSSSGGHSRQQASGRASASGGASGRASASGRGSAGGRASASGRGSAGGRYGAGGRGSAGGRYGAGGRASADGGASGRYGAGGRGSAGGGAGIGRVAGGGAGASGGAGGRASASGRGSAGGRYGAGGGAGGRYGAGGGAGGRYGAGGGAGIGRVAGGDAGATGGAGISGALAKNTQNTKKMKNLRDGMVKYFPSLYDPVALKKFPELMEAKGFIKSHNMRPFNGSSSKMRFGNFSIASINARLEKDTLEGVQSNSLINFVDSHHPTVVMLQGLSKGVMDEIEGATASHYKLAASGFVDIDRISMKEEYQPIMYDSRMLREVHSGNFVAGKVDKETFATFTNFEFIATGETFTVINVDLFSADSSTIDTQVFMIIKHIKETSLKESPIMLGGTINVRSAEVKSVLSSAFKNLVSMDKNNNEQKADTFHSYCHYEDGIPRDFILLRDKNNTFSLNYARILKGFDTRSFSHFPVLAILTRKKTIAKTD